MLCVVDRAWDDKFPLCSAAGPEMHQKFVAATDLGGHECCVRMRCTITNLVEFFVSRSQVSGLGALYMTPGRSCGRTEVH